MHGSELYQARPATQEIIKTPPDNFDTALQSPTNTSPQRRVNYEIFQALGETVALYATKLKKLAASFEFYDMDAKIKAGYAVCGQRTKISFQGKLENIILFNMP